MHGEVFVCARCGTDKFRTWRGPKLTAKQLKEMFPEVQFTFTVTVTVPPEGSEDAGDYGMDLAEATSALGFEVGPFELVTVTP